MTAGTFISAKEQEFTHNSTNGSIDLHLFSETCAHFITNRFQDARYKRDPGEPWKQTFPTYIASIIHASNYNLSMPIAALTLVARYQDTLVLRSRCCARTVDEACRLFLIAYIIAGSVLHDEQVSRKFWQRVSGEQYSCSALTRLEMQFYDMVNWRVCIDPVAYAMTFGEVMQSYRNAASLRYTPVRETQAHQRINRSLKSRRAPRRTSIALEPRCAGGITLDEDVGAKDLQTLQGATSIQLTTFKMETRAYNSTAAV